MLFRSNCQVAVSVSLASAMASLPASWQLYLPKAWAEDAARRGAGEILLTSMDRDGTKIGFNLDLTRAVAEAVPVPVIASGGVGELDHFVDGIQEGKANAVLAASVFHFGTFSIGQVKAHMAQAGIPMRELKNP